MFAIDEVLLNRYRVFGYRKSQMTEIYFANDIITDKDFALKTCREDMDNAEELRDKFMAELTFFLDIGVHINILPLHFIEIIEGRPYMFSDYIVGGDKGTTLRERMNGSPLERDEAIRIAYQICCGMEYVNQRHSIAHLDLKPENILVDTNDIVKICDFGLVKKTDVFRDKPASERFGSWPYMAPEQWVKQNVDTRTDIYSFGILLYELITGKHPALVDPTSAPDIQCRQYRDYHINQRDADDLYWQGFSEIDGALGAFIGCCIPKKPGDRYMNFHNVRGALESIVGPGSIKKKYEDTPVSDLLQRGIDFQKINRHSQALTFLNRYLLLVPGNAMALYHAAISLWHLNKMSESRHILKKAAKHAQNDRVTGLIRALQKEYST